MGEITKPRASKFDAQIVDRYLALLGLQQGGSLKEQALRLQDFLDRYVPHDSRVECEGRDGCGGYSHQDLMICPFCGDDDGQGEEEAEKGAINQMFALRDKANGAKAQATTEIVRPVVQEAQAEILDSEEDDLDLDLDAEMSREDVEKRLAFAGMVIPTKATEKDLDEAVGRISELHRDSMINAYDLGAWLLKVKGLRLWELRKKDGKAVYASWNAFVSAETKITRRYADKLMAVVYMYTREAVKQVGISTLYVLIGVESNEKREELVQAAAKGELTGPQAREEVLRLSGGKAPVRDAATPGKGKFAGTPNRGGRPKKAAASQSAPAPAPTRDEKPAPKNAITVALAPGKRTLGFFRGGDESKPAKRVGDEPSTTETLANGTVITYRLVVSTKAKTLGQIQLQIDVSRPEDA